MATTASITMSMGDVSELVLDILSSPQRGPFTNEDGEVVIDADGRRVQR